MNNKFIVINDKVIVLDENANSKTVNYQNNIYEILLKENQIEELEIINKKTANKIDELKNVCKQSKIRCYSPLIAEAISLGVAPFFIEQIIDGDHNITFPILGEVPIQVVATLFTGICCTPLFGSLSLSALLDRRKDEKELNALKSAKIYLENKVLEERNNLEILKKANDNSNLENSNYVDSDEVSITYDKDFNVDFNNQTNFYYNVGRQAKKYKKYLQKGKLEEKLRRRYSDDEIKEVKEIIKKLGLEK